MILKCETCGALKTHPREVCEHCKRGKRNLSPWAQEEDGYLPVENLLHHMTGGEIADRLGVARTTPTAWARRQKMFTVEQACMASELCGLNPFEVWPELETNVPRVSPSWHEKRACVDVPTEVFFPTHPPGRRSGSAFASPYEQARKYCTGCPVRNACLWDQMAWESSHQRDGMFGGLTPVERSKLAKTFKWRPRAQIA